MSKMHRQKEIKYISNTCLYNYSQLIVENGKNNILYTIDMREIEKYKAKHFKEAIHKTDERKLQMIKDETIMKNKIIIVFYDDEETQKDMKRNVEETLETEKENKKNKIKQYAILIEKYFINVKAHFFVLNDGFTAFEKEYPFLCLSEEQEKSETKNKTVKQLIASINYPLRILENVYLGNFIHINNIHIYRFLKIKHVYDFTGSGFSNKWKKDIHYHRYDVFNKQFKSKNFSKKEPITYSNYLSIQFLHNIIYDIAKHDQAYQKGEGRMKQENEKAETAAEKETKKDTKTDTDKTAGEEKKRTKIMGTGREEMDNQFKDANMETNAEVYRESNKDTENRNIECRQEETTKQECRIKEDECEQQNNSENKKRILPKLENGAHRNGEMPSEQEGLRLKQQQKEEMHRLKSCYREKENEIENAEMDRKMKKKHGINMDETKKYETNTDNENEEEFEKNEHATNKMNLNLKTKTNTKTEKNSNCDEPLQKSEKEENVKEQNKINAILILCNEGIKNQTKNKINSISLIICMCYIMFRKRCSENFAIARFLKICNDLEINAHTFSVLKSFYYHLQSSNFCLEKIKLKENVQKNVKNNMWEQEQRNEKKNFKNDQNKQNEHGQRSRILHKNGTYSENSENSENSANSDNDGKYIGYRKNEEYQKQTEIGRNTTTYEQNKNNVIDELGGTENIEDTEDTYDEKRHTKKNRNNKSKRNRPDSMEYIEHPLQSTLLEIRKNDMCKGILSSFKIKKHFVIFEENKNNIIHIKYDAPGNNTKNTRRDYSLNLMNKNVVIHNITNDAYYDYEHLLASILYNIYNCTLVETEDVETCVRVLYEATNFEKHKISVTMPYISLILFNLCVLKNNNERDISNTRNMTKKETEKHNTIDKHIEHLLHNYTKDSIRYILYAVQIPNGMSEIKITFQMTTERLRQTPLAKEHYLVLAALKYFLITLLYFYVNKYIETLNCICLEKFHKKLLKYVNTFADCYYAKFTVDIHKFLKPNYVPEVDPYDNLPYYFSDVLRPFILLHNYFVE